jgi:group I intron endonuclease
MWFVYFIQNSISGKVYVGITGYGVANRWSRHKTDLKRGCHKNGHLQSAWNRYGANAFECVTLDSGLTREQAGETEENLRVWFEALDFCYNMKPGGGGGIPLTEEAKRKIGEKNRINSRGNSSHKGHKHSEETKRVIREKRASQVTTDAMKATMFLPGITPWNKDKSEVYSEEALSRMSVSGRNRPMPEKSKAYKFAAGQEPWNKGRKHSEESIERMRRAKRNPSDEIREKLRQAALRQWQKRREGGPH